MLPSWQIYTHELCIGKWFYLIKGNHLNKLCPTAVLPTIANKEPWKLIIYATNLWRNQSMFTLYIRIISLIITGINS